MLEPILRFPEEKPPGPVVTVSFGDNVLFATGKSDLKPSGRSALAKLAAQLGANPPQWIKVAGHTDSRGGDGYNEGLSQDRADKVAAFLEQQGLTGITADGKGESDQACPESGKRGSALTAAQACNRRVEISYKVVAQ